MDAPPISPAPSHTRLTAGVLAEVARRTLALSPEALADLGLSQPVLDAAIHGAKYDDEGGREAMRRAADGLDQLGMVPYTVAVEVRRAGQLVHKRDYEVRASNPRSATEAAMNELRRIMDLDGVDVQAKAVRT